jgi:Icc-related predicted phosphoesterase
MRIVAVADTHMFHADLAVPDGDVFVHAGDLCRRGELDELRDAMTWIRGLPHRHKIVVAGNHDWALVREPAAARDLMTGAIYLQDEIATVDGITVWGSPWQPEFNDWAFNLPRGPALAEIWNKMPVDLDILITHGPPAGIGDRPVSGRRVGCADLWTRVADARPRLHLFGHIHEDGGFWREGPTSFANVTTHDGERAATVIDYDPETGAVRPIAIPPGRAD